MIVICQNDYPVGVVPEGTTEKHAALLCRKLSLEHPSNIEMAKKWGIEFGGPAFFRWHDVPEMKP